MMEQPVQSTVSTNKKGNLLVYLSLIILAVLLGVGGYYLGSSTQAVTKTEEAQPQSKVLLSGLVKTQQLMSSSGEVLTKTTVIQNYYGKLKAMDPGLSWTLEKAGKTVTLLHEGTGQVEYLVRAGGSDQKTEPTTGDQIKIGDTLSITVNVDPTTGLVTVQKVTLVLPLPKPAATSFPTLNP